jgi:hypothetical protein
MTAQTRRTVQEQRTTCRRAVRWVYVVVGVRVSGLIFVWAVLLNFPWELGQAVAYTGVPASLRRTMQTCGMHSLIDGLMVLGMFWGGVLVFRRLGWIDRPGLPGYVWMGTVGFFVGVVIELNAVYRLGTWGYRSIMPLMPGLGVGLLPILQLLVLPPLIFALATKGRHVALETPCPHT